MLRKKQKKKKKKNQEKYFFSCNVCEKGFRFKTQHGKHHLTHATEPKVYYCPYGCGKHYVKKCDVEVKHRSKCNQNLANQKYCLLCNSVFPREEELYEHLRTLYRRNGSYFCSKCQNAFPHRRFLNSHEKSCEGIKADGSIEGKNKGKDKVQRKPSTGIGKTRIGRRR